MLLASLRTMKKGKNIMEVYSCKTCCVVPKQATIRNASNPDFLVFTLTCPCGSSVKGNSPLGVTLKWNAKINEGKKRKQ